MKPLLLTLFVFSTLGKATTLSSSTNTDTTSTSTSPTITDTSTNIILAPSLALTSSTSSPIPAPGKCDPTPYANCPSPEPSTFTPSRTHFGPTSPATLRVDAGAESAALAALSSVTASWTNGPSYMGLKSAVYEAAPTPIQQSLAISGYDWESIIRASWYTSVPEIWQDVVTKQEEALQEVYNNITAEHAIVVSAATKGRGGMDGHLGLEGLCLIVGVLVAWLRLL